MADASAIHPITYRDYNSLKIQSDYQLKIILQNIPIQNLRPEVWKENRYLYGEALYPYVDATPSDLRNIKLTNLFWTDVDWRSLTDVRTTSELDEKFFSRLVEMEKFKLYTRAIELRKIKYNKEQEEENETITASSVSYSSFCRHSLEDVGLDEEVNVNDQVDTGKSLLDSIIAEESEKQLESEYHRPDEITN